jgi:hypothetical protein
MLCSATAAGREGLEAGEEDDIWSNIRVQVAADGIVVVGKILVEKEAKRAKKKG